MLLCVGLLFGNNSIKHSKLEAGPQAYASSYAGHARVARLLFIASKTAGMQMELEALRLAADQLRKVCFWFHVVNTKIAAKRML